MLEVGQILEGKVTGLTGFGAFVALPDGKSGMVHISEVSNVFVKEIKDHLTEGQDVRVKIIALSDDGKISLSIKQAAEGEKPAFQKQRQKPSAALRPMSGRDRPRRPRPKIFRSKI